MLVTLNTVVVLIYYMLITVMIFVASSRVPSASGAHRHCNECTHHQMIMSEIKLGIKMTDFSICSYNREIATAVQAS